MVKSIVNPLVEDFLNIVKPSYIDKAGNLVTLRPDGSKSVQTINNEPTMTIQSEIDACDVNKIYAKYSKTGMMTNMRSTPPQYGDFMNAVDYHTSVFRAQEAQETFMSLPAALRKRFSNDPGELLDFLADSNNRAEAIKLGLIASPQADQMPQGDATPPSTEVDGISTPPVLP